MATFDVSKGWVILIPAKMPTAAQVAEELSHCIDRLRCQAELSQKPPLVQDTAEKPPDDAVPIILLNVNTDRQEGNGFSWRIGKDRIEIYGESGRGLCNGVFDFLGTLGFRWPAPDREVLPPLDKSRPQEYTPKEADAHHPSGQEGVRRRLVFNRKDSPKRWESLVLWAARNKIDTLVFSLQSRIFHDRSLKKRGFFGKGSGKHGRYRESLCALAQKYELTIEGGGWDLSLLVSRRYFLLNQEIFRMDSGTRKKKYNFCPTAPATIKLLTKKAEDIFRANPEILVYHFWPDRGHEKAWCSCPTCRAFTLEEQNRIAVNAVADSLAKLNPCGRISYYENSIEKENIAPRSNMFKVTHLPGEPGAEATGWLLRETAVQTST
ncbi:MAG: DUF4838 domain-containing protein [Treponema sp.]|nr:DUF4838 domain-containing protein [Treponema sp.]